MDSINNLVVEELVVENEPNEIVPTDDGSDRSCRGFKVCDVEEEDPVISEAFSPQCDYESTELMVEEDMVSEDIDGEIAENEGVAENEIAENEVAGNGPDGLNEDRPSRFSMLTSIAKKCGRILGGLMVRGGKGATKVGKCVVNAGRSVRSNVRPYCDAFVSSLRSVNSRRALESSLPTLLLQPAASLPVDTFMACVRSMVYQSPNCAYYRLWLSHVDKEGRPHLSTLYLNGKPMEVYGETALACAVNLLRRHEGAVEVVRIFEDFFGVEFIAEKVTVGDDGWIEIDGLGFENFTEVFKHLKEKGCWRE